MGNHVPSPWEVKGVAIAGYTAALLCEFVDRSQAWLDTDKHISGVMFHTRFSYWLSNGIGVLKVTTLVFISITGFVVLGGFAPHVSNPQANFVNPFEGRPTPYGLTSALYRIIFAYGGFDNAFNVVNEVKVRV